MFCSLSGFYPVSSLHLSLIPFHTIGLFIWGFYVAFNTVQVISRRVVGRAEETSTYSSLGFCTVNYRPTASNYQLSHLRPWRGSNPGRRGGRRECYHSATVAPFTLQAVCPVVTGDPQWRNRLPGRPHFNRVVHTTGGEISSYRHLAKHPCS